ncbi:hypothetical protein CK203_018154 [Vitis vinifera]|uniref:Uncharacterized protein n=1 Tax=Vitis vinifera TaxID=29760 RepID=A0A438JP78_VITVI|nr:hypothetical protein CK203_018154 [Vitis vinifera]
MEPKLACLGSSLSVPCVQAGTALTHQVPPRYLLPEQDPQFLSNYATTSMPHFLIINFRCLLSADCLDSELEKLHRACLEWGFFRGQLELMLRRKVKFECPKLPIIGILVTEEANGTMRSLYILMMWKKYGVYNGKGTYDYQVMAFGRKHAYAGATFQTLMTKLFEPARGVGKGEGLEEHKQDTKQKEEDQFMRVICVDEASNLKGAGARIYMDHICQGTCGPGRGVIGENHSG